MAGHSKWANIKHKKGREDAKRGKVFSKMTKEITVAARLGGGDPDANPRLRQAVDKARSSSMPKDNIKRAILKGSGEGGDGVAYEEIFYEGYGPGGVAVYVGVLTDNKNRTVGEVRQAFVKSNGSMGESGCVAWIFEPKGYFLIPLISGSEDEVMELALEAGAEDVAASGDQWEITSAQGDYGAVRDGLEAAGITPDTSELTMIPQNTTKIEGKDALNMMRLMDRLEDLDDVQNVYANFDIDDAEMERLAEEM
jgi:YebC/PmpR family DNA-binding regulatory protein